MSYHLQLLLPNHHQLIQTNNLCRKWGPIAIPHTDAGGKRPGTITTLNLSIGDKQQHKMQVAVQILGSVSFQNRATFT